MFCSLSGVVPEEPVVSKKSGHVFEKRLIEKYIKEEEKCPITGEELTADDILPLKSNKAVKPRTSTATSIPGLLSLFQQEWDDMMLESYTLKQHLDRTRQELSQALYQYDASCRVIARLIKERDAARNQLAVSHSNGARSDGAAPMDVEGGGLPGITPPVVEKIVNKSKELANFRKGRKNRKLPEGLPSADDIAQWKETSSHTIHKSDKPGILSVSIHPKDNNKLLTAGVDRDAKVFNRASGEVEHTLSGHSKRVTRAVFHPTADMIFTSSQDKTVKVWTPEGGRGYNSAYTFSNLGGEVTGLDIHPTNEFLSACSKAGNWGFYDIASGQCLAVIDNGDAGKYGYECLQIHPDGQVMGTGTDNGIVKIWDLTTQQSLVSFEGHKGAVSNVSFSENGYYMASAGSDGVRLWDLRKLKNFHTIETSAPAKAVAFDPSALYLAMSSGNEIKIFETKKWDELATLQGHKGSVTSVAFGGENSSFLASTSMDRSLKLWQ